MIADAHKLTEVISTGEMYVSVAMQPDGQAARLYVSTRSLTGNAWVDRPELVRVHDALGRLLKLTATSLNDAVDRERGVTT